MSDWVLDASIALSWLIPDETGEGERSIRYKLTEGATVWVPTHWRLEIVHALWAAERRKRIDSVGISRAVAWSMKFPVCIDPETGERVGHETLAIARQYNLSIYDAAYLELALRKGAALATFDKVLKSTAIKLGIPVLPDS